MRDDAGAEIGERAASCRWLPRFSPIRICLCSQCAYATSTNFDYLMPFTRI